MEIKAADLIDIVATKVTDELIGNMDISDEIKARINEKVDAAFAVNVDDFINKAINDSINNGFEKEYTRVDRWGVIEGEPTTIKKELEKITSVYWGEKVDKYGNPTSSSYNNMTRAEYLMNKICSDDFSKEMEQNATNITGYIKDGLRSELRKSTDKMLDGLFRVKSLHDQGKVEKTP